MTDATNPFHPADVPSDVPADRAPGTVVPPAPLPGGGAVDSAPRPIEDAPDDAIARETDLLEQLEADLAAVETAIATIERISVDGVGGEQAAVEIGAAVSVERFGAATGSRDHGSRDHGSHETEADGTGSSDVVAPPGPQSG